jgi:hypothetical protein
MAGEDFQINGGVVAESIATERVAFDLMDKIAGKETLPKEAPRRYYLELYSQCLYVVKTGGMPTDIEEHPTAKRRKATRRRPRTVAGPERSTR